MSRFYADSFFVVIFDKREFCDYTYTRFLSNEYKIICDNHNYLEKLEGMYLVMIAIIMKDLSVVEKMHMKNIFKNVIKKKNYNF